MYSVIKEMNMVADLEAFLQQMPQELIEGRIVRLRYFGSFMLTHSSEGVVDPYKFTSMNIKKLRPRFMPVPSCFLDEEYLTGNQIEYAGIPYSLFSRG